MVFAIGTVVLGSASTGCGEQCDRNPNVPPVEYKDGKASNGVYESSPFSGPYLDFPSGRTYRFYHYLGGIPRRIDPWVSFDVDPVPSSNEAKPGGGTTPIVGNQFTVERVTATTFDVRNDTCSDIKLRVVASDPEPAARADAGTPEPDGGDAAAPTPNP